MFPFITCILMTERLAFTDIGTNKKQSPKGNMWSAIPVALLCMLVIVSDGLQGSGPKGYDVSIEFVRVGYEP